MDAKKGNGQHQVPDVRLAKAFNFTSEDLAANRLGFITSEQEYQTPIWQRQLFARLGEFFKWLSPKQRLEVGKRCGRVEIEPYVETIGNFHQRGKHRSNSDMFSLYIKDRHFKINRVQHQALVNNAFYIIYYNKSNLRIVAMERVENDC